MIAAEPLSTRDQYGQRAPADPGDAAFVLGVLSRQRRFIAKITAAGLALGALVWIAVPPSYKASAEILIDFKRLTALDENYSTPTGRIDSSAVLSQLEVLTSEGVLRRVVIADKLDEDPEFIGRVDGVAGLFAQFGLISDPAKLPVEERRRLAFEALRKATTGERVELSYAISVTVKARTGEKAARLANSMAHSYIEDELEAKRQASERASEWFSQRIAELQNDVSDAERATYTYRLQNNIVTNDGKFMDEQQMSDLSQSMLKAGVDRASAEAKVAQVDAVMKAGAMQSTLVDEFSNQVLIDLRNAYLDTMRQAAELAIRYGATHDAVIRARAKGNELQNAMNDELGRIREGARSDLAIAQAREATLKKELADLTQRSLGSREKRVRLTQLEAAADTVKSIRDTFMERYVSGIQTQSFPITEARIITVAQPPTTPSFPTPFKTIGAGLVLGFGLGALLAIGREAFTRRTRFVRELQELTGLPCYGFLPTLSDPRPAAVLGRGGERIYLETLRGIKVDLDLRRQSKGLVIGFVSVEAGEGVSLTAGNFARLCASLGGETLLVDGNLRHPALTADLAPDAAAGLVDVVEGRSTVAEAIRATADPRLHVLPGHGATAPASSDWRLPPETTNRVLRDLAERWDYVVVDLPALGIVADARAISEAIGVFVMVVAWNRTETHVIDQVLRNNASVRRRLVGCVFNRTDLALAAELGEPGARFAATYHG